MLPFHLNQSTTVIHSTSFQCWAIIANAGSSLNDIGSLFFVYFTRRNVVLKLFQCHGIWLKI